MADTIAYKKSGNPFIDLLNGADDGNIGWHQWVTNNLTYSFPTNVSQYGAQYAETSGFRPASEYAKAAVSEILRFYSSVSGLTFTLVPDAANEHSDLQFGASSTMSGVASGYGVHNTAKAGDVWFSPSFDEYGYAVLIHEIGHVMGLDHAALLPKSTYWTDTYTVMPSAAVGAQTLMILDIAAIQHRYGANFSTNSSNTTYMWDPDTGEMFIDGVAQGSLSCIGGTIKRTIWDGNGSDTYDFSNFEAPISIDLRPGRWTTIYHLDGRGAGLIANAMLYKDADGAEDNRSLIENATGGAGCDSIIGNLANNMLNGGGGNDTINGGAGNDTIDGGTGNDIIDGGAGSDHLYGGFGNDIFVIAADPEGNVTDTIHDFWKGDGNRDIIDLSAVVSGVNAANFTEWKSNNVSQSGKDTEIRLGDNRLVLINVQASYLDYSDFKFEGNTLQGGTGNDTLTGSSGYDLIYGTAGNDVLDGKAGNDTLEGGAGTDIIYGGTGDDIIRAGGTELLGDVIDGGEGVDTLQLTSTVTLSAFRPNPTGIPNNYRDIEILDGNGFGIQGTSNDDIIDLTGFLSVAGLAFLNGGMGNDTLNGSICDDIIQGGVGADIILGGFGDDIILVGGMELIGDTIDGGEGTDTLKLTSDVTASLFQAYSLRDNSGFRSIERLDGSGFAILGTNGKNHIDLQSFESVTGIAFVDGGPGDDYLRGWRESNILYGGSGNDQILGGDGDDLIDGGTGADIMRGGRGNDIYVVDNIDDIVEEEMESEGIDTVHSSISYSLISSATLLGLVENLTLTGSANINGSGNSGSNVIIGNTGNNTLDGGDGDDTLLGGDGDDTILGGSGNDMIDGGAGADIMRGGSGNDIYIVDNASDIVDEAASGSSGTDTVLTSISYSLNTSATLLGLVENLTLTGDANIDGTGNPGNNVITGNAGNNILDGGNGNDTLLGGGGIDWLFGAGGDDILDGGPGSASVCGGSGSDTYLYATGYGSTHVISDNGSGADSVWFIDIDASGIVAFWDGPDLEFIIKATDEVLRIANQIYDHNHIENFIFADGANWSDTTMEATAKTIVRGTTGFNTLNGTANGDVIFGLAASDNLYGHAGDDILLGGLGNDTLSGGTGDDSFIFAANFGKDTITDFVAGAEGGDIIEFHSSLFNSFESVLAKAQQIESDVVITCNDHNILTLENVILSYLNADDFMFFT